MMMKLVKQELKYQFFSKNLHLFSGIILVIIIVIFAMNYTTIKIDFTDYEHLIQEYTASNMNIDDILDQGFNLEEFGSDLRIENPLPYYQSRLAQNIYASSVSYAPSHVFNVLVSLSSVLFAAIGVVIACYDYHYKTIKVKTVRMTKLSWLMSKQIALVILILFLLLVTVVFSYIVGFFSFLILSNHFNISQIEWNQLTQQAPFIMQFLFIFAISIFYGEIGYILATIVKSSFIPIICIFAYAFVIPLLGSLNPHNIISYYSEKLFNGYGIVLGSFSQPVPMVSAILVMVSIVIGCFLLNVMIVNKRSSFC